MRITRKRSRWAVNAVLSCCSCTIFTCHYLLFKPKVEDILTLRSESIYACMRDIGYKTHVVTAFTPWKSMNARSLPISLQTSAVSDANSFWVLSLQSTASFLSVACFWNSLAFCHSRYESECTAIVLSSPGKFDAPQLMSNHGPNWHALKLSEQANKLLVLQGTVIL